MRNLSIFGLLASALTLTACQTGEAWRAENDAAMQASIASNVGATIGQVMERTGESPSNAYNGDEGRTFTFEPTTQCRIFFVTDRVKPGDSADAWRITRAYHRGFCPA